MKDASGSVWVDRYDPPGMYMDVDTSGSRFSITPTYITSITAPKGIDKLWKVHTLCVLNFPFTQILYLFRRCTVQQVYTTPPQEVFAFTWRKPGSWKFCKRIAGLSILSVLNQIFAKCLRGAAGIITAPANSRNVLGLFKGPRRIAKSLCCWKQSLAIAVRVLQ